MGFSVWFSDLETVLEIIEEKLPLVVTFNSIKGNAYGDFIIETDTDKYIVQPKVWKVFKQTGNWKNGKWVEVI